MVEAKVRECLPCQAATPDNTKNSEPLKMTELPKCAWQEVSVDFAGPFPTGEYLLVVIDNYSRYPEVEVTHSTSATATIPKLDAIFARQGVPAVLISDNGPPFSGYEFARFAEHMGFHHRKVTPLWPQANGEAEKFMQPLQKAVRTSHVQGRNWRQDMHKFLRQYRATPHSTTGVSPFEALTGRKMRIMLPEVMLMPKDNCNFRNRDKVMKETMKGYADRKACAKPSDITQGDVVLIKQKKQNKLSTPFSARPYQVQERKGSMVTAERQGHKVTRNSSFFRKVNIPMDTPAEEPEEDPEPVLQEEIMHPPVCPPVTPVKAEGETNPPDCQPVQPPSPILKSPILKSPIRRSSRTRQQPVRFQDYVQCVYID